MIYINVVVGVGTLVTEVPTIGNINSSSSKNQCLCESTTFNQSSHEEKRNHLTLPKVGTTSAKELVEAYFNQEKHHLKSASSVQSQVASNFDMLITT